MNDILTRIYKDSKKITISDKDKIVIMSDCHRGAGDNFDNFLKNRNIYNAALNYYYKNGFTYIELGDGDEMWEVKKYQEIVDVHLETFKQIKKFHDTNRLLMIYGNHDIAKKNKDILEKYFYKYYNMTTKKIETLLNNLVVYESLVLNYKMRDIFLIHGHQVDFLNGTLLRFSRFLVRYIWHVLEFIGTTDPTSAAKNYFVSKSVEKKLQKWSKNNNTILIAGHTHRPIFPKAGQSLYFNDGSCIHPNGVTGLEINKGKISLVRWEFNVKEDGTLFVTRNVLAGDEDLIKFYNKN